VREGRTTMNTNAQENARGHRAARDANQVDRESLPPASGAGRVSLNDSWFTWPKPATKPPPPPAPDEPIDDALADAWFV